MHKVWLNTYDPSLKFSGKEGEATSGDDYFGARYFSGDNYRFLSIDPVRNRTEALANPKLWNLYSYCRDNPITFHDPDGSLETKLTDLGIILSHGGYLGKTMARYFTPRGISNGISTVIQNSSGSFSVRFRYNINIGIYAKYSDNTKTIIGHEKDHIAGYKWFYNKNVKELLRGESRQFDSEQLAREFGNKLLKMISTEPKKWTDLRQTSGFLGSGLFQKVSNSDHVRGWRKMRRTKKWTYGKD